MRKRQVTYTGKSIKITADFSTQTLNPRRPWRDIFQALKENNCQTCQHRQIYLAKLSFLIEGEMKNNSTTSKKIKKGIHNHQISNAENI
jgi:hypothetical protein